MTGNFPTGNPIEKHPIYQRVMLLDRWGITTTIFDEIFGFKDIATIYEDDRPVRLAFPHGSIAWSRWPTGIGMYTFTNEIEHVLMIYNAACRAVLAEPNGQTMPDCIAYWWRNLAQFRHEQDGSTAFVVEILHALAMGDLELLARAILAGWWQWHEDPTGYE